MRYQIPQQGRQIFQIPRNEMRHLALPFQHAAHYPQPAVKPSWWIPIDFQLSLL